MSTVVDTTPATCGERCDPSRLARALGLVTERTAPGVWMVTGGRAAHAVTGVLGALACDCRDFAIHGATLGPCKHVLAVELHLRLPAVVLDAFRGLVHPGH